eukprot:TRINITY_DN17980_c0_g1_i1.p1 TRINITY_DN17980_c0_g1~~TRINITY_DN17980_c0_g1_i1.p1  ORF type:complete len:124 (+),score=0.76 TRINITY_DN17980_c0_g1_i1:122-493(+)
MARVSWHRSDSTIAKLLRAPRKLTPSSTLEDLEAQSTPSTIVGKLTISRFPTLSWFSAQGAEQEHDEGKSSALETQPSSPRSPRRHSPPRSPRREIETLRNVAIVTRADLARLCQEGRTITSI